MEWCTVPWSRSLLKWPCSAHFCAFHGIFQGDEIDEITLRSESWWHDAVYHEADHCMKWPHSVNVRISASTVFLSFSECLVTSSNPFVYILGDEAIYGDMQAQISYLWNVISYPCVGDASILFAWTQRMLHISLGRFVGDVASYNF